MPWRHQFRMTPSDTVAPGPVEAVERPGGDVAVELGAVEGGAFTEAVEHLDRQAAGVGVGLQHQRRHRADQHRLGHPAGAVPGDVAGDLAAAGRVADVHGVAQVEMLDHGRGVGGVGVHVVAVRGLGRAAVTATVVGDDAVAVQHEEHHLGVPVVGAERPSVVEHDRLTAAPVLVEDLRAVLGGDEGHVVASCERVAVLVSTSGRQPRR